MLRVIGAVVVGYVVMALVVFAGLSMMYAGLGVERAFRPGVYDPSALWVVISLVIGFGAALLGGWLARRVGRVVAAPRGLAALVLVLGLALALPALFGSPADPGARGPEVGTIDAMQLARTPLWIMLVTPFVGAVGVLLGGRALGGGRGSKRSASEVREV